MRSFIFSILLLFSLDAIGQVVDKQTQNALEAIQHGYIQEGVHKLVIGVRTNDLAAQYYLAGCYEKGLGVEENLNEAFQLYRRAAERGLPDAMYKLSWCYLFGYGVELDIDKSKEWNARFEKKGGCFIWPFLSEFVPENLSQNDEIHSIETTIATPQVYQSEHKINPTNTEVSIAQTQKVKSKDDKVVEAAFTKTTSEVDIDIPRVTITNENTFVLIIANETYQDVAPVPYAHNDGDIFYSYCAHTLGVPPVNIHLVKDATLNNIRKEINLMSRIAEAYKGEANIIIYYAGHGTPDESTGTSYLLPVDGYGSDLTTCISLVDIYNSFGQMRAAKVIFFLDACFSGSTRGTDMLASARGVAIKSKSGRPTGNTVVISAAQGDETAFPFNDQHHGLFTFYLLKKLKETNGNLTLGELAEYINDNVVRRSLVVNGKLQTPAVLASPSVGDTWKNWTLR